MNSSISGRTSKVEELVGVELDEAVCLLVRNFLERSDGALTALQPKRSRVRVAAIPRYAFDADCVAYLNPEVIHGLGVL